MSVSVVIAGGLALGACKGAAGLDRRQGPEYRAETESWKRAVVTLGGNGMWLVVRGYHLGDDMVAIATNSPVSHASVLDLERNEVIEAVGKGVVATDLDRFLTDSHQLTLIRPTGWSKSVGAEALRRARSKIGAKYDFLGIVGAPQKDHFYCSELAAWSIGLEVNRPGPKHVLHPRDMPHYGTILFETGERDGRPDE